jgi:hypothetical protein
VVNVALGEKRKVFEVVHRFTGAGIHHIFIGPITFSSSWGSCFWAEAWAAF